MTVQAEGHTHRRACWQCGTEFAYTPVRKHPRFCSERCRKKRVTEQLSQYRKEERYAGYSQRYYAEVGKFKPRKKYLKICAICEAEFQTELNRTETCGSICGGKLAALRAAEGGYVPARKFKDKRDRWRHANHMRRATLTGSEKFSSAEIFERDGWRCGLCGRSVDRHLIWPHPMSPSLDHILPLSLGGRHTRTNAQLAHLSCNSRKQAGAGGQLRLFG